MGALNRRTAVRIAIVSVVLAAIASPIAWIVALRSAEDATVSLAVDESRRLLHYFGALSLDGPDAADDALRAADALAGGLFDIAEIYDADGRNLAAAMTAEGRDVEAALPPHARPRAADAFHERLRLPDGRLVLRTFVPLRDASGGGERVGGYFEGVRVVSAWQHAQMLHSALNAALMVGLASLACGVAIYPVVVRLSADNARKAREVLESHVSMMEALGRAIAQRDSDTGAHNFRVAWIAARLGERMGLRGRAMQALIAGSFLHDVGKISVPDAILRKPGRLDDEETAVMQTHVARGAEIVEGIGWLEDARAVVAAHHEKWDGTGYPAGLAGTAIPLTARIFAVADVFDALCSARPYKAPMDFASAAGVIDRDCGRHFDPAVIAAFRPLARALYDRLAACSEDDARRLLEERVRVHFGL